MFYEAFRSLRERSEAYQFNRMEASPGYDAGYDAAEKPTSAFSERQCRSPIARRHWPIRPRESLFSV